MNPKNKWPDFAVNTLVELWKSGYSSGIISNILTEKGFPATRNSVIGKANRMSLDPPEKRLHSLKRGRLSMNSHRQTPRAKPVRAAPVKATTYGVNALRQYRPEGYQAPFILPSAIVIEPDPANEVPLLDSRPGQCKAIVRYKDGLPSKAIYCGMPAPMTVSREGTLTPSSWCNFHKLKYLRGAK